MSRLKLVALPLDADDASPRHAAGLRGAPVLEDASKEVRDGKLYDGGHGDPNDCTLVAVIEHMGGVAHDQGDARRQQSQAFPISNRQGRRGDADWTPVVAIRFHPRPTGGHTCRPGGVTKFALHVAAPERVRA